MNKRQILDHKEVKRLIQKYELDAKQQDSIIDIFRDIITDYQDESKKWVTSIVIDKNNEIHTALRLRDDIQIKFQIKNNVVTSSFFQYNLTKEILLEKNSGLKTSFDKYLQNPKKTKMGFYLVSNDVSKSTMYVNYLVQKLTLSDFTVAYVRLVDLLVFVKDTFSDASRKSQLIRILKSADILFLIDIGREIPYSWFRDEFLEPILNHRADYELITFFTSTFTLSDLKSIHSTANGSDKSTKHRINHFIEVINTLSKEVKID